MKGAVTKNFLKNTTAKYVASDGINHVETDCMLLLNAEIVSTFLQREPLNQLQDFGCNLIARGELSHIRVREIMFSRRGCFYVDDETHCVNAREILFTPKGIFAID